MTFEIRPIHADDETDWRRLWTNYLRFYRTSVPEAVYTSSFGRLVSNAPGEFCGFVALRKTRPVGLAHYLFHRHGWRIEDVCYLQDLWVEPTARGSGVARALIGAVYDAADRHGCGKTYWMTQETNATARRLYDRIADRSGFIEYERRSPDPVER